MKYTQVFNGEWVTPRRRLHKIRCCDCGLVHIMQFRIKKGILEFRAWRDNKATSASRRKQEKQP